METRVALGWALAATAFTPSALADTGTSAIVGGELDIDDPTAVALVERGGELHCSAVVIAPDAVLTAGHCISSGGSWRVVAKPHTLGSEAVADVVAVNVAPDFDRFWLTADLGIAFVEPALEIAPAPLADGPVAIGQRIRVVGYGRSEVALGGIRRALDTSVVDVAGDRVRFGRGACDGDSGGPVYRDGAVLAVVSASTRACEDSTAADVTAHRDWIAGALAPQTCSAACDPSSLLSIAAASLVALRRRQLKAKEK